MTFGAFLSLYILADYVIAISFILCNYTMGIHALLVIQNDVKRLTKRNHEFQLQTCELVNFLGNIVADMVTLCW